MQKTAMFFGNFYRGSKVPVNTTQGCVSWVTTKSHLRRQVWPGQSMHEQEFLFLFFLRDGLGLRQAMQSSWTNCFASGLVGLVTQ